MSSVALCEAASNGRMEPEMAQGHFGDMLTPLPQAFLSLGSAS